MMKYFWGARSYSEVLSRIQALPPGDMADFLNSGAPTELSPPDFTG
jgi:hypothetical protein